RARGRVARRDGAARGVGVAERLAGAVARASGNVSQAQDRPLLRADILAARRENEAALALYEACADTCLDHRLLTLAAKSLNRGGILTAGTGDYGTGLRLYRKSLRIALAAEDSLNVPRHLMNIARRHRLMGRLDSCLVYQRRAEVWVAAYPDLRNRARLPLMQAEYHAQVGDYATVDSLLATAAAMTPNLTTVEALAELHLQIIKDGLERGSPGAAYRSIALLDSLRDRLGDSLADRNVTVDLDLHTAEFLTRQGQSTRALAALERAREALARRPDPGRAWQLARTQGTLARRRGDLAGAEAAYRDCVGLAERIDDPDLLATGSLLLSTVLMDRDRFAEARAVLGGDGGRFRTRLTVRLFRGMTYAREGRYDDALAELAAARAQCTPRSPRDLVARIDLETGRAQAGAGQLDRAAAAYAMVREELSRHGTARLSGDEADYYGDLRRDLVEAELSLETPDGATARDARRALERTCALLPGWRAGSERSLRNWSAPQLIFFCGQRASFRWDVAATGLTLRGLPGEPELAERLGAVLADLGRPGREVVAGEMAALVAALGGLPADWPDGQTLRVIPDGVLHGVPWAALHGPRRDDGWLDRGPIVVSDAPSPHPAAAARRTRPGRLLALGADEARADDLAPLRHAEREAREVHDRWPADRADLRTGGGDLRSQALGGYDVIHVASHAMVYRGSSREASLMLNGDRNVPLTLDEIRDLDLDAELVFLSCCEAADGSALHAGQAHADLANGFLDAGAAAVVAPTLVIEDEAARHLAGRFYDGWLAGEPAAVALRDAQIAMRDGGQPRSHPFYWAFYLVLTPH
ncbi:CHAT domain-containing protein, partial [bacterium]|nr:CHAT domain-containing protein [bacterium]